MKNNVIINKIIKQARALSREIIYWSTLPPGACTKKGISEFSFLVEVVVPRADDVRKLIKKYSKTKGAMKNERK